MIRLVGLIVAAATLVLTGVSTRGIDSVFGGASNTAPGAAPQASSVGQWSAPSPWPVVAIHTTMLPNGKILTWQRKDSDLTTMTYLWDPATNSFTQIFNPNTSLFCSGHSLLQDGRLLVTGGHHFNDGYGEPHTNIFDFNNNTWTRGADMNLGRWYPTNTTLPNGEVLTVSGTYFDGSVKVNTLPQVWNTSGSWRSLTGAQGVLDLYPWMFVAPNGKVFHCGPEQATSFIDTAGAGSLTTGPNSNFGYRDYGSAVMYDSGKILIAGGGQPTNTAEVIDLISGSPAWRPVASMAYPRRQMNALILADGKVLVTGGTTSGGFNTPAGAVYAAEMWDPVSETWSTMASMQVPRLYHSTTVLLPDGRVLSAGGGMGNDGVPDHFDAEIYSPPYLFKGPQPTITSAPTSISYGQTFTVNTPDKNSIAKVTMIRLSSVTHAFNENQRINYLTFAPNMNGLTLMAPATANECPPGHYMLFIVNGNGVPSVAKIISIAPAPEPPHIVFIDAPAANQAASQPIAFGGWAIDKRTSYLTGMDAVHVYAQPAGGGTPVFIGAANYGGARPDVGAVYGAQYTNSGFSIIVKGLPQGPYNFTAYGHSLFNGLFDTTHTIPNVTVNASPILFIDTPGPNATVPHTFNLVGWAIDFGAAGGSTGVNTVHVWAYPVGGGPAVFVGAAAYGASRPDVASAYGSQFTNSGFYTTINSLPAGTYDLALFPYSTVNNYFFPATVRRITVSP